MVARQTGTASLCLALILVSHSKSSTPIETISSEMAPPGAIIPSPMPQPVLQNGLHQTCSCTRPTMQPQTSHHRLVKWSRGHMLLQTLAEIQDSSSQPIRPTLGLAGSLLHSLLPADLAVTAEGSLLNKVFPSKKEYHTQLKTGLHSWAKRNGLPSMPNQDISDLCHKLWTEHSTNVTCHISKSSITTFQQTFDGAIFHCEDKQASSLRIYCPCLYYQAIDNTFQDPSIFEPVSRSSDDCHIPCRPPSTTTQQIIPMGSWPRTTSPSRVHSGQTKVGVPKWSTHHFLC